MGVFRRRAFILLYLLLIFVSPALPERLYAAQNVSGSQWQQLTSDKAFGYKNDKEGIVQPKAYQRNIFQKIFERLFAFFGNGVGTLILWVLVIGLAVYVVYKLFLTGDSFLFGKNVKALNNTNEGPQDDEDIADTNWEKLLQNAAGSGDVRMAVRYSYMWLLQLLQQKELIKYRTDKTNYEYYRELAETHYKQPFRQLSRHYEYTWYGRFALSPVAYNEYIELFNNVRKQLGA